ncbi:MAG: transporter substrate-binding domain-containing protein [Beijerinckiaceae bacterium]|jgi:octopine/nopaline transport system substrate-binding protein
MKLLRLAIATLLTATAVLATAPTEAKEWTHVNFGSEGAFPPWNMIGPDGQLAGYEIDLAHDLCRRAKLDCSIGAGEWTSLIPSLNAGKFDLILGLGINEARKKVVDFTIPYASGFATFSILKGGPVPQFPMTGEPLNLNEKPKADPVMAQIRQILKGKIVGVIQSSSHEQLVHAYFGDDVTVRTYKSSPERDLDLRAGRVDASFDSAVYMNSVLDKPENQDLAMTGPLLKGAMLATEVAIGMRKNEPELKAIFDKAIREATEDGTIRQLSLKWTKVDLTPASGN